MKKMMLRDKNSIYKIKVRLPKQWNQYKVEIIKFVKSKSMTLVGNCDLHVRDRWSKSN